jgi:hypothetical protein
MKIACAFLHQITPLKKGVPKVATFNSSVKGDYFENSLCYHIKVNRPMIEHLSA